MNELKTVYLLHPLSGETGGLSSRANHHNTLDGGSHWSPFSFGKIHSRTLHLWIAHRIPAYNELTSQISMEWVL